MNAGCKTVRSLENACHTWAPYRCDHDKALYKSTFTFTFTLEGQSPILGTDIGIWILSAERLFLSACRWVTWSGTTRWDTVSSWRTATSVTTCSSTTLDCWRSPDHCCLQTEMLTCVLHSLLPQLNASSTFLTSTMSACKWLTFGTTLF